MGQDRGASVVERGWSWDADLPPVDLVTFAQSLHWMDRPRVVAAARSLLRPGGSLVHVHAATHRGQDAEEVPDDDGPEASGGPRPPWAAIEELARRYLGPFPRAGRSLLPAGAGGGEDEVYAAAGLSRDAHLVVPAQVVTRTLDQIVAAVHSLSSSTRHLFGDRLDAFDADLTRLLAGASDHGCFRERMRPVEVNVWR